MASSLLECYFITTIVFMWISSDAPFAMSHSHVISNLSLDQSSLIHHKQSGQLKRSLRLFNKQRLQEPFHQSLGFSNHHSSPPPLYKYLGISNNDKTTKPLYESLEFSNAQNPPKAFVGDTDYVSQHKTSTRFVGYAENMNQHKYPFLSDRYQDLENHHGMPELPVAVWSSPNDQKVSNSFRDSLRLRFVCPKACKCEYIPGGTINTVDCSNRKLTKIPELPPTTRKVYLQNNTILDVPCTTFQHLRYLKECNLSQNKHIKLFGCSFSNVTSLEYLWLNHCQLTSLPAGIFDSFRNLLELDLSDNNISSIEPQLFMNMRRLSSLDLSTNHLRQVLKNTFQGLSSLVFLSLRWNRLTYVPGTFEGEALKGLTSLKSLHLEGNQPHTPENFTYPDQILADVPGLEELWLDAYPEPLGSGFSYLLNLSSLIFSGNGGFCYLSTQLPLDFFSSLSTKKPLYLDMSWCNIVSIPPEFFKPIPNINALNLNGNEDLSMDGFERGSKGLENSFLTVLNISQIVKPFQVCSVIKNSTFQHLKNTKLKVLVVETCRLVNIDPQGILDLPNTIEYLSFYDNKIVSAFCFFTLNHLKNLKVLKISNQLHYNRENILTLNPAHFSCGESQGPAKTSIRYAKKRNRLFESMPSFQFFNSTNKSTSKMHTRMKPGLRIFPKTFSKTYERHRNLGSHQALPIPLAQKLEVLYASDIKLSYDIPRVEIINNHVLSYLDFSANNIKRFNGPVYGLPSIRHVDLSQNYCFELNPLFFSELSSLTTLLLYNNELGRSLAKDIEGVTFSFLPLLEKLDLSNNFIQNLPEPTFLKNENLQILNLSNNALSHFQPSLKNQAKLEILDLSLNSLEGFSEPTCKQLLEIKKKNKKFTTHILGNNGFQCSCENMYFLSFLLENPGIFKDVNQFTCKLKNGTRLDYARIPKFLPQLGIECLMQALFIVVLIAFFLVTSAFTICSLYYYKRWQWKYLFYVSKNRLHIGSTQINYRNAADAFVTYDQVKYPSSL